MGFCVIAVVAEDLIIIGVSSSDNQFPRLGVIFFSFGVSVVSLVVDGEKFKGGFSATNTLSTVVFDDFLFLFSTRLPFVCPMPFSVSVSPFEDSFGIAGLTIGSSWGNL
jgi:hypothetical protein